MISVSAAQLQAWLAAFVWPLARVLALVASAPLLGSTSLPARVKIGLGVLVTLLVAPTLGPMPAIDPASGEGLLVLAEQAAIGLAMGLAMQVVFDAVEFAGEISGLQMGLGFATLYDPQGANQVPVVAQYLGLVCTLVFLSINGHLMVIDALAESFRSLPVGLVSWGTAGPAALLEWGGRVFTFGLALSLPLLAALLITNLALGMLTRAAPQLNIFAVGFPLTLFIGFVTLLLALPSVVPVLGGFIERGLAAMVQVLAGAR